MKTDRFSTKISLRKTIFFLGCFLFLMLVFNCQRTKIIELVFTYGPEDSGTLQGMIDHFNKAYKGEIHVTWKESSRLSNEFYREIEKDYQSEIPGFDVLGADVVWTSAFAANGWVEDLSKLFYDQYHTDDFVEAALNSVIYQYRIWGIPWHTDAGILFYRKDLLRENGFNQPPATWTELRQMAKKIMADKGIKYGFVFQGANYEGGVTNACEYIWNAGGSIMIGDLSAGDTPGDMNMSIITINSKEAIMGLTDAYLMVEEGVTPEDIYNYRELEAALAFKQGDAVFMRTWPGNYGLLISEDSKIKSSQIGVAPLPVTKQGNPSYSCLGGWNLMINSRISPEKKEAAWKFIRFLSDQPQQEFLTERVGNLPSLKILYESDKLVQKVPAIPLAKKVIQKTHVRPVTPYYMDISPDMAWAFNAMLKGELEPVEVVETIQAQFEEVLAIK